MGLDLGYQLPLTTLGSFQSKSIDRITISQKKPVGDRRSENKGKRSFGKLRPSENSGVANHERHINRRGPKNQGANFPELIAFWKCVFLMVLAWSTARKMKFGSEIQRNPKFQHFSIHLFWEGSPRCCRNIKKQEIAKLLRLDFPTSVAASQK